MSCRILDIWYKLYCERLISNPFVSELFLRPLPLRPLRSLRFFNKKRWWSHHKLTDTVPKTVKGEPGNSAVPSLSI
jgi:hypothetical protein